MKPFDEIKYKSLMDGLECSEITFKKLRSTITMRFDSEYYQKIYIKDEIFLEQQKGRFITAQQAGLTVDASAFYPSLEPYYNTGDIPFIRVADVKERVDYKKCVKIPKMGESFKTLQMCKRGDIVLTKGGRIGTAGLITCDSYVTRDLIFVNSSKLQREDYISLYLYYCSKFAYRQMLRSSSMTAQPHLTITLIRELPIWLFSPEFKKALKDLYDEYENIICDSERKYNSAKESLLSILNLDDLNGSNENVSIKYLSQSFSKTGRLDAEYYQGKYDRLFMKLSQFETRTLGNLVSIKKSIEPGSDAYQDQGIPFVRVSDIDEFEISRPSICLPENIIENVSELYPKRDTILFSKDGSVGIAYKLQQDEKLITSGALLHLTVKDRTIVLPEYLTLVLNSPVVQLQAERDSNGAIIQHWKPSEIENVVVPILDLEVQKEIAKKVIECFQLRHKAKEMLQYMKHAVELAIEQTEKKGLNLLMQKKN